MNSTARQKPALGEAQRMSIVGSAQHAIITIDQSQRIVRFNRAAERIFGYPTAHAMGEPLSRFIPERFRAFPIDAATALFRIVQEALTNVAKHAQANLATLRFSQHGERGVLRIADCRRGKDRSAAACERSFGLPGIHEPVRRLGGEVTIKRTSGRGFSIEAIFPRASLAGGAT